MQTLDEFLKERYARYVAVCEKNRLEATSFDRWQVYMYPVMKRLWECKHDNA